MKAVSAVAEVFAVEAEEPVFVAVQVAVCVVLASTALVIAAQVVPAAVAGVLAASTSAPDLVVPLAAACAPYIALVPGVPANLVIDAVVQAAGQVAVVG